MNLKERSFNRYHQHGHLWGGLLQPAREENNPRDGGCIARSRTGARRIVEIIHDCQICPDDQAVVSRIAQDEFYADNDFTGGLEKPAPRGHGTKMQQFLTFLAVGTFFSTVEEFLTVVVLKHDVGSYVFTLLILFPVFLTLVYFSSKLLDRWYSTEPARELAHYFVYGCAGLALEWFLIGLSPWSNPDANPFLMLLFQLGMFSFWATVAFAPRLLTNSDDLSRSSSIAILKFYVPYFVLVYVIALAVPPQPPERRFWTIIPLILIGYLTLNVFYVRHFRRAFARRTAGVPALPGESP